MQKLREYLSAVLGGSPRSTVRRTIVTVSSLALALILLAVIVQSRPRDPYVTLPSESFASQPLEAGGILSEHDIPFLCTEGTIRVHRSDAQEAAHVLREEADSSGTGDEAKDRNASFSWGFASAEERATTQLERALRQVERLIREQWSSVAKVRVMIRPGRRYSLDGPVTDGSAFVAIKTIPGRQVPAEAYDTIRQMTCQAEPWGTMQPDRVTVSINGECWNGEQAAGSTETVAHDGAAEAAGPPLTAFLTRVVGAEHFVVLPTEESVEAEGLSILVDSTWLNNGDVENSTPDERLSVLKDAVARLAQLSHGKVSIRTVPFAGEESESGRSEATRAGLPTRVQVYGMLLMLGFAGGVAAVWVARRRTVPHVDYQVGEVDEEEAARGSVWSLSDLETH